MDWTAGYASDVEYTAGFYREQSPAWLNFVSVLNGFEPVPLNKSFTYFELGFGRGLTANLLAAANPQGQFYAADFNPGHVAGARQLASSAGLENLILLENSFAELADGQVKGLPQFDFITLHGIYTWVTAENQAHIVDFISRYLKPGGIVYMSYNAMPGWAVTLPLQRLLVEHADLFPNRSDLQIKGAVEYIEKLEATHAGYFTVNPGLKPRMDMLKTGNSNYLVHEYMHKHWKPLYFADVARDMSGAKLDYVGSADLPFAYPGLFMAPEKLELINALPDANLRETIKDYFLNTSFRKDVFVRGARRMGGQRQAEWLSQVGLALLVPRADVNFVMKLTVGEVNAREDVYGPVLDALAKQPQTLAELAALPSLKGQGLGNLGQIAAILTASGQAAFYFAGSGKVATDSAHRMNRILAANVRYGDEFQVLTSPLLGNGLSSTFVERLVYLVLGQNVRDPDPVNVVKQSWQVMSSQGRRMIKEGKLMETEAENLAELELQIKPILAHKLPLWRQLKMI
jgi:SAM-dependent methyltransferase